MKLCECGCEQEVRKRFVKGHQIRISNPSKNPEVVQKIRDWHTGKSLTVEHKEKISRALKGIVTWSKGLTKTTDIRIANMALKVSRLLKGRIRPKEESLKAGMSNRGKKRSIDFCAKMSVKTRQYWGNPNSLFNNPIFLRKRALRGAIRPTKPELNLLQLIQNTKLPFKYVGNGEVIIGRRCPDFININGKKQIIELYGDYWHKDENPQEKIDLFAQYGFSTLIIWEHELKKPDEVLTKLKEFCR